MGLPTKKQLQKHRRGTRKALDTLEALNSSAEEDESKIKKIQDAEPGKDDVSESKENSTAPSVANANKKQSAEKIPAKKVIVKKAVEEETIVKAVVDTEIQISAESSKKLEKSAISLETTDERSAVTVKQKMNGQQINQERSDPDPIKEVPMDQMDNLGEDTQKDRFLSFRIGKEDYGIEICFVTEIIVMHAVTEVPDTPSFIKGVINLRGKVIPVMDVRERFKLEKRVYDDRTCIIVVDVGEITVGLIVDTVNEVIDIPENKIDPPPATHSGLESNYIKGMGKVGKKVKILLDLKNVLRLAQNNNEI